MRLILRALLAVELESDPFLCFLKLLADIHESSPQIVTVLLGQAKTGQCTAQSPDHFAR
jgi:hypothetical protein